MFAPSWAAAGSVPPRWKPAKDCRANIQAVLCRVTPQSKEQAADPRVGRKCLGGEAAFVSDIEKVHDNLPAKLQKMFCHLRRIYIEEELEGTAYATQFPEVYRDSSGRDRVRLDGHILALSRRKVFEAKYSLTDWLNRKEQTAFGRRMEDDPSPLVPAFEMNFSGVTADPLLLYVIVHEFGHLLDFAFGHTTLRCGGNEPVCKPELAGLWPSLSWLPDEKIRPEDRYFGEFRPCYYGCEAEKTLPVENAAGVYRNFVEQKNFVSLYASVNAWEDFAESFLFYVGNTYFSPPTNSRKYFFAAIHLPGDDVINLNSRVDSGRILAKMKFMSMLDAMPWQYQPELAPTYSLEEYMRARGGPKAPAHSLF